MDRQLPLDPYTLSEVDEAWRNRSAGVKGHAVKHEAFTQSTEEIVHVIEMAGLDPTKADLTQLWQALQRLGVPQNRVVYRTPGASTFVVPAGVTRIHCTIYGAGGGGGACNATGGSGTGGGAGGYAEGYMAVTPGASIAVVVGAGGAGGVNGGAAAGAGGASSVAGTAFGNGGGGGSSSTDGTIKTTLPGSAGTASGLAVLESGRTGQFGYPSGTFSLGGLGGGVFLGPWSGPNFNQPGGAGIAPGGGGGASATAGNGGAGAPGRVVISY
jgi:hypothetical protein